MFLSNHNVGVSTWEEFADLRGDNIWHAKNISTTQR
jgi:hypothetical protein